jgi:hypothetical protein
MMMDIPTQGMHHNWSDSALNAHSALAFVAVAHPMVMDTPAQGMHQN